MEDYSFKVTDRQAGADGWASFCMFGDPLAAWESLFSVERLSVENPLIGGLAILLQPFEYLAARGTSEAQRKELDAIRESERIVRHRWGRWGNDVETADRLAELGRRIETGIRSAEYAEELLRKHGWKFDPTTGKVREVAKRKGGELLPRMIQRLGVEYGTGAGGREKIKKELSPYFEDLDAGPRGNIARALENLKR